MNIKNILIGVLAVLLLILLVIIGSLLLSGGQDIFTAKSPTTFSVIQTGAVGDYGYTVFNYRGNGNLTILSYPAQPKRNVVIINDSQAVDADQLPDLVQRLSALDNYGFNVSVSNNEQIGNDIYVIPTGAMPSYALFNLEENTSNGTIIYIGAENLLLSNGIKQLDWYSTLTPDQKGRLVLYNGTLNQYLSNGTFDMGNLILTNGWLATNSTNISISGAGLKTVVSPINTSGYMRVIYNFDDLNGTYDSPYLNSSGQTIAANPPAINPGESSFLQFSLNKTSGTAFLTIEKDGSVVDHEQLMRVTDQNVFIKKLSYTDPGYYTISVDDNTGQLASGIFQVHDVEINLITHAGVTYVFSATVDGQPMTDSEVMVSLDNSTNQKKFYVTGGEITIPASLNSGTNTFNFDFSGSTVSVQVVNQQDPLFEFYLKYGIPGLIIIGVVYFGARMTRRPSYSLRFGDSASYIRQEITLPTDRALESFQRIRQDMKLGNSPITPQEFTISLKRYLTNGADITEGNVEEILKKLVEAGQLESHRDYYQLKGEGDVKRNTLSRMVREKLIESGTSFNEKDGKFKTKDYEIGFFGDTFDGKAVIVVDDKTEEKTILNSLTRSQRSRYQIMQSNDMLSFISIDRLSDML